MFIKISFERAVGFVAFTYRLLKNHGLFVSMNPPIFGGAVAHLIINWIDLSTFGKHCTLRILFFYQKKMHSITNKGIV